MTSSWDGAPRESRRWFPCSSRPSSARGTCTTHLELLRPRARQRRREFGDPRREGALETEIFTDLLQPGHQLRAAQQGDERTLDAFSRACDQVIRRRALGFGHCVERGKRQTFLWQRHQEVLCKEGCCPAGKACPSVSSRARALQTRRAAATALGNVKPFPAGRLKPMTTGPPTGQERMLPSRRL